MRVGEAEINVVADALEFNRQMRRMFDDVSRRFAAFGRDADRAFGDAGRGAQRFSSVLGGMRGSFTRVRNGFADAFDSAESFRGSMRGTLPVLDRVGSVLGGTLINAAGQMASGFGTVAASMLRVAAAGAAVGAIAGAIGAAAAATVQFAAAIAPAAGAVAALPSVVGVAAAAVATLQVALSGVGDAFSAAVSGDAAEFEESLEGLAPSAQAAALALREITPEFTALRESVQGAFFEGFDTTLENIAATLVGPLTEGMTGAASATGSLVNRLGEVATSSAGVAFIESSFAGLQNILVNLQEPLAALFEAFLDVGTAVSVAFGGAETAGAGLASMIDRFAEFLSAAAESGQAVDWVEGAITVFSQLGDILSPVIGILGSVGEAASATGGNILGAMGGALEAVNEFLGSAEGMSALTSIFETLNQVGGIFGDVLSGLLPVIAPIVGELVSGLVPVLQSLVPLITQIGELAGPIFLQILDAVLPLVPPLANLAMQILPLVATLLTSLPLLEALTTLLVSILEPLLPALEPILLIFGELAVTLSEILTPVIELIGEILLWLVEEIIVPFVIPMIEFLAELFADVLAGAVETFADIFTGVVEGIAAIFEWLGDRWDEQTEAMSLAWEILQGAFESGWNFIRDNVIDPIVGAFQSMGEGIRGILDDVEDGFNSVVDFLGGIPDDISNALSGLWEPIWEGFKSAINSVIDGWNNLSFTVPSVDLGPLGSVGGFTISTPNIPRLQTGGITTDEGLAMLHPSEAVVPLETNRGIDALADALIRASEMTAGTGLGGTTEVRVFIGDTELTEIIDVQIADHDDELAHRARTGSGRR